MFFDVLYSNQKRGTSCLPKRGQGQYGPYCKKVTGMINNNERKLSLMSDKNFFFKKTAADTEFP
jgi:hypothetical protein